MAEITVTRSDLGKKVREILEQVHQGGAAIIENLGRREAVLLDALDYRLLRSLADLAVAHDTFEGDPEDRQALVRYLRWEISLGKVAEELEISRFELMGRFERLGIPLHLGPESLAEARAEVAGVHRHGKSR